MTFLFLFLAFCCFSDFCFEYLARSVGFLRGGRIVFLSSFPIVFSTSSCVDGWAGKGGAAKGAQVAMGRPCLETKRWQVGKADALLGPTRRRTQAGKTGNKMGRRFRGLPESMDKSGRLGGKTTTLGGREKLDLRRKRRCEAAEIPNQYFPGHGRFFPAILRGPDFPTWEP